MLKQAANVLSVIALSTAPAGAQLIGERPSVERHLNQADIDAGAVSLEELFAHGKLLFNAKFNALDGQGRPATTGHGLPREPDEPFMIRTSGPDATACLGCHNDPRSGGAGEFVSNVFVLAQTLDPVTFSVSPEFSNERNSLGMMGAGPIEMLAREMSVELIGIRTQARAEAARTGKPVTRPLVAKGVDFGSITVLPNGKVDPTEIEGVDWDLIVKPFHQKGAVVSLREFTNNAMNHHHGIQSVERFGLGTDPDQDGVVNELSVGDITAATIYQAALNTPAQVLPDNEDQRRAAAEGASNFVAFGCAECHLPEMVLESRWFTEPNPFNPAGNLRPGPSSLRSFAFDMTAEGEAPRLEPRGPRGAIVRAFTDLKRHNLNDDELNFFANEQVPQGKLNGFAPASDFTIEPPVRPTREFLTRKLWDAGNTGPYGHRGDLSTLTEAIYFHGGQARASRDLFFGAVQFQRDCVIEFLKTLRVVEPQ